MLEKMHSRLIFLMYYFSMFSYTCVGHNRAGHVSANMSLSIVKSRNLIQAYSGEEVAGMVLGLIFIFLLIFIAICVVVLRSKSHYEDINSGNRVNQSTEQNRCQSDERKLLSVHMNHNSYVTSVVTSNHLEMKTISDTISDSNHQTIDKSSDSNEDNNCLIDAINVNHNCFKTNSDVKVDPNQTGDHLSSTDVRTRIKTTNSLPKSDNKYDEQFGSDYCGAFDQFCADDRLDGRMRDNKDVITACVPTTSTTSKASSDPHNCPKPEELLRRRASDVTDELNKRFAQKRLANGRHGSVKEGSQPTVRFNNNAIIYNYQCQRFGHSMESLDSDSNGYTNNELEHRNSYNYANGQIGTGGPTPNRSHPGFSYTMRPTRAVAKHYRRSGGSLAALLGIDARDSPDEGLGDEREYETDILE